MAENHDGSDPDYAAQYESRSEKIKQIIALASDEPDLNRSGLHGEIADEVDCTTSHVSGTLDKYDYLVDWYRNANLNPLDPEAVEQAYDDEDMAAMASSEDAIVGDGAGNIQFNIRLTGQQAFRAMKLLPGDLGMSIFQQVLTEADELDEDVLEAIYQD